jgi:tripartite-type tricarboxylate transporter receptor subunit TctC
MITNMKAIPSLLRQLLPILTLCAAAVMPSISHAAYPEQPIKMVVAYAKANPGKVTYGATGIGSDDHLAALMLERAAGVQLTHIPFKGASGVRIAVTSKQIVVAAMNIGEALQYQKAGTPLRHLGQMSQKRSTLAQDVPKNLPSAIREQLVTTLQKVVADSEFQAKAAGYFAPLRYLPPTAYAAELKDSEAGFEQLWQVMPWTEK